MSIDLLLIVCVEKDFVLLVSCDDFFEEGSWAISLSQKMIVADIVLEFWSTWHIACVALFRHDVTAVRDVVRLLNA